MDNYKFLNELRQLVVRRASVSHLVDTMAFIAEVSERLLEDPVFGELIQVEYIGTGKRNRNLRLHGYTELDESDGTIGLIIGRWSDSEKPETLLTETVNQLSDYIEYFLEESLNNSLNERITESNSAYEIATYLQTHQSKINRVRLHIFSNQALSSRFKEEMRKPIAGIAIERHIWDLTRLRSIYESSRERESVEIDFLKMGIRGIPCLEASCTKELRSFLCVIDGKLLADLFERWGSRLLEGNVRSFLGMKGGVNKGIRTTIRNTPHLFFAYNNGIAATAADIILENIGGQLMITRILDLQIVNGGQTTASILSSRKKDGLSLNEVSVPMKLTEVSHSLAHELIPRIAQFANTQNKIAMADFFANHPFHTKIEDISRRLTIPTKAGVRVLSKWFYERSRGQYQNGRLYLTVAQKNAFDLEYPANQVINKTDLAKYDSVLNLKPYWINLGAQKNFIKFADKFSSNSSDKSDSEHWAGISPQYGEAYFQDIVAIAIIWKETEKIISGARGEWYKGDYRPQITSFTLSLLFETASRFGGSFDLREIWKIQDIDLSLKTWIRNTAINVQEIILSPPMGTTNVGEWTKKEDCWSKVKEIKTENHEVIAKFLINKEDSRSLEIEKRKQALEDDNISLQAMALSLTQSKYWASLLMWNKLDSLISSDERKLLFKASSLNGFKSITRQRDWARLFNIRSRCENEGFKYP